VDLEVRIQGAEGTVSEVLQEQFLTVRAPAVAVAFSAAPETQIAVESGEIDVVLLAPGYNESPPSPRVLNDLADVEAQPEDGSLLQYDDSEGQWIAGPRLRFRPALRAYLISA